MVRPPRLVTVHAWPCMPRETPLSSARLSTLGLRHHGNMAEYFDVDHAREIEALGDRFAARTEWPTWLLIFVIYGGWLGVLLGVRAGQWPLAAATPPLIVLCAWHMSLQHELLHGHPTRSERVNKLLGYPPLAVWYPYTLYRDTHLEHHRDEDLTAPGIDPESNYVPPAQWARLPRWRRALWRARKCFVGRLAVGPPASVAAMAVDTLRAWRVGDWRHAPMWAAHVASVVALLAWLQWAIGMPWWYYLLAITWPAQSLAMIRSLYEHRAAEHPKARIAINEAGLAMRALYLNNNYHLVHHDLPELPWYHLPRAYRMRRDAYARKCGGFVIRGGYWELLKRHAWRETDSPAHPFADGASGRAPRRARVAAIDGCVRTGG
ncbi:fatty acid desaturase [Burkholderia thailandensis]|nr:fatty acid desaturase [Burkholderia thailandensis]